MSGIWKPFTQMLAPPPGGLIDSANGAYLYKKDGQKILDAISSWWVINHGHCHPHIMQAIRTQTHKLDQVLFSNFHHEKSEELIENLKQLLDPKFQHFFFSDNGSTSVEVALKMTLHYFKNLGSKNRTHFLSFTGSYHGDTVGAMSLNDRSTFTNPYKELLFEVNQVKHPGKELSEEWKKSFLHKLDVLKGSLAGLILEPLIQGAGGMIPWPKESLEFIITEVRKTGALVIFDEVMTGFYRTGKMFAYEHLSPEQYPDLLCLSKGLTGGSLPMALTVATSSIYETFLGPKSKMFYHGHSFTGNLFSCAAAVASCQLFLKNQDTYSAKVSKIETHFLEIKALIPNSWDPRVIGTILAFELPDQTKTGRSEYTSMLSEKLTQKALNENIFIRPLGNTLYFMPPYSVEDRELQSIKNFVKKLVFEQDDMYC